MLLYESCASLSYCTMTVSPPNSSYMYIPLFRSLTTHSLQPFLSHYKSHGPQPPKSRARALSLHPKTATTSSSCTPSHAHKAGTSISAQKTQTWMGEKKGQHGPPCPNAHARHRQRALYGPIPITCIHTCMLGPRGVVYFGGERERHTQRETEREHLIFFYKWAWVVVVDGWGDVNSRGA